jgi:hypothetical protein
MLVTIASFALALFLTFPAIKDYLYLISMTLTLSSLYYMFYKNRFELLIVVIVAEDVHLSFVNNTIYKRNDIKVKKELIRAKEEDDKLVLFIDGEQQAIVRKKAVDASDWEKLLSAFVM